MDIYDIRVETHIYATHQIMNYIIYYSNTLFTNELCSFCVLFICKIHI
jgi:hypothetical protein